MLQRGRSERVDSVLEDPEVDQQAARQLGVRSALYVPLVARGRAIGVVIAHDKAGADPSFTDDDLRLTESLADRAAVGGRPVRAGRPRRARARRRGAGARAQAPCPRAPRRDGAGAHLDPARAEAARAGAASDEDRAAVASLRELVVSTLQDVRRLAVELRPTALDDFGLATAVERLAGTFREQTGMRVDFEAQLGEDRLPSEVETTLYRIVQEALTNIVKHADASHVSILLTQK